MKNISLFDDVKHFVLNFIDVLPQQLSKVWVHVLLTVGVIGGWKLFRKHAKKFK